MAFTDSEPLPAAVYSAGTMSYADVYPSHVGIGGITTQDRALPAYAEAMGAKMMRSTSAADPASMLGTPAGALFLLVGALLVAHWVIR